MHTKKRISAVFSAAMLSLSMLTGCGMLQFSEPDTSALPDTTVSGTVITAASSEQTAAGTTAGQTGVSGTAADTAAESDAASGTGAVSGTAGGGNSGGGNSGGGGGAVTKKTNRTAGNGGTAGQQTVTESVTTTETKPKTPEEIVSGMTLEQKAAQMMLVGITDEKTAQEAAADGVGALCMFAKPYKNKTKQQVREMHAAIQKKAAIPMIISADEEGGSINRLSIYKNLRSSPFPTGKELFTAGGWNAVISGTKEKSALMLDLGLNVNLAPVCDVPLDSSNYIYNRCFSLDAEETAEYIGKVVTQMNKDGLGSVLKHFPGYGGSVDTHKNMGYDTRDYSAFENGDFLPFKAGIADGADAVMVSHNIVKCKDDTNPASLSPIWHQILRNELHFDGVVISDDLGMNAITLFTNGKNPAVAAVQAGNDLVAYADYKTSVSAIVKAVKAGTIPQSQIDASVLRILRWKQKLGLL
ncbi:MAG: beta-hexosaminidase [Oscillospiraceae bacterium]|nr:beta-hexosaminidase [Oscillospiraceae bacterium]